MGKLATPDWVKEGFDSKADWQQAKGLVPNSSKHSQIMEKKHGLNKKKKSGGLSQVQSDSSESQIKEKVFKLRKCPKCGSTDVNVVLSNSDAEEGGGKEWECKKCKWHGKNIEKEGVTEEEFMEYLDKKGEEVA